MLRILIIRVSSLGDVVHNLPVVADILRLHPDAQIGWLVEEAFINLVRQVKGVRHVIPFALRRWRKRWWIPSIARQTWHEIRTLYKTLHREPYDVIIDCQGLVKTALAGCLARGPVIGLGNRSQDSSYEWPARFFYRRSIWLSPKLHVIERSRQLVATALGDPIPQIAKDIDFGLPTQVPVSNKNLTSKWDQMGLSPHPYLVFIHATSRADKEWPLATWIALSNKAIAQGLKIILPWGSAAEQKTSQSIAAASGPGAYVLPQRLDWPEIIELLQQAKAVVGVDTGLVHIACALKRPTIELYNFDTAWRVGGHGVPSTINIGGAAHPPTLQEVEQALQTLGVWAKL